MHMCNAAVGAPTPMDVTESSPSGAANVSQQLHAIARLLGIKEQDSQQAGQLIDAINKSVASRMSTLPQAFHEAVLPEGALSERQARPCSLLTLSEPALVLRRPG